MQSGKNSATTLAFTPETGNLYMISVLVSILEETFDEDLYLMANPDVKKAGVNPRLHFTIHGEKEGRKQINPDLLSNDNYRRKKFERFSSLINLKDKKLASSFPVFLGTNYYDLSAYQAESANDEHADFGLAIRQNAEMNFMDLGCGLRKTVYENCLYVEVYPSLTADVIVDPICQYPFLDNSFDGVGCFAVLEHTRQPWLVAQEIYRIVKPGGTIWIDWPFLQPVHGYPSHFFNATQEGMKSLFEDMGFKTVQIRTEGHQTPAASILWILGNFIRELPDEEQSKLLSMKVSEILSYSSTSPFWSHFMTKLDKNAISRYSCGNVLVAKKC